MLRVKLNRDVIVKGSTEPRGEPSYGKQGEVHEFDDWTAHHLASGDYPAGEIVDKRAKK